TPEHAGKRIMTEVLKFGYDRVHGECRSGNIGNRRVMERAGMQFAIGLPTYVPKDVAHFICDIPTASA
ncbi:hypothetical protein BGX33_000535, partial [Mortierella sp. NVP41]